MKREQMIKELFNLNSKMQVLFYDEMLKNIKDDELIQFKVFAYANKREYETEQALIARVAKEYLNNTTLKNLQAGRFKFKNVEDLREFLLDCFKGLRVINGIGIFKPFVIISVTKDGRNFFNEYSQTYLNCDDEALFLFELIKNQTLIGKVRIVNRLEYLKNQENLLKQEYLKTQNQANEKMQSLVNGILENKKVLK